MAAKYLISYHMSKENTLPKYKNIKELKDSKIELSITDDVVEVIKNLMVITLKESVKFDEIYNIYVLILAPKINDDKLTININGYDYREKFCFSEIIFIKLNDYNKLTSIYKDLTFIDNMNELKLEAEKKFGIKIINDITLLDKNDTKTEYYINLEY